MIASHACPALARKPRTRFCKASPSSVSMLREEGDALQNLVLGFLAKAGQACDAIIFARLLQFVYACDVQLIVDGIDLFWPDARNTHHGELDRGRVCPQFIEKFDMPAVYGLLDAFDNR